jgi:hypothetical protein
VRVECFGGLVGLGAFPGRLHMGPRAILTDSKKVETVCDEIDGQKKLLCALLLGKGGLRHWPWRLLCAARSRALRSLGWVVVAAV